MLAFKIKFHWHAYFLGNFLHHKSSTVNYKLYFKNFLEVSTKIVLYKYLKLKIECQGSMHFKAQLYN